MTGETRNIKNAAFTTALGITLLMLLIFGIWTTSKSDNEFVVRQKQESAARVCQEMVNLHITELGMACRIAMYHDKKSDAEILKSCGPVIPDICMAGLAVPEVTK